MTTWISTSGLFLLVLAVTTFVVRADFEDLSTQQLEEMLKELDFEEAAGLQYNDYNNVVEGDNDYYDYVEPAEYMSGHAMPRAVEMAQRQIKQDESLKHGSKFGFVNMHMKIYYSIPD